MLSENPHPGRKKRPPPRYKSPRGIAYSKTLAAKRAGLNAPDAVPSRMPAGRRPYDVAYLERHPHARAAYNARRRRERANAKALLDAPTNSPAFFKACLQHPDCPKDEKGQAAFVIRKAFERAGITLPE